MDDGLDVVSQMLDVASEVLGIELFEDSDQADDEVRSINWNFNLLWPRFGFESSECRKLLIEPQLLKRVHRKRHHEQTHVVQWFRE